MATDYRIVCATKVSSTCTSSKKHLSLVGTGNDPSKANTKWTIPEVRSSIGAGNSFHTISPSTSKRAEVERYTCGCGVETIRSKADAVTDNNLDNLRSCNW